jgi:hypothetical protein
MGIQEWELRGLVDEDGGEETVVLAVSTRLERLLAAARTLSSRLEVPLREESEREGGPTAGAPGEFAVLPGGPASLAVAVRAGGLEVSWRGKGRGRLAYLVFLVLLLGGAAFAGAAEARGEGRESADLLLWMLLPLAGICALGAAVQGVLLALGHDRKLLRVDARGVHATTGRRGAARRTIPLDRVTGVFVQKVSEGGTSVARTVTVVGEDGTKLGVLCDSEEASRWLVEQLRSALRR